MSQRHIYKHGETTFIGGPEAPEMVTIVHGIRDEVSVPFEDVLEFVHAMRGEHRDAEIDDLVNTTVERDMLIERLRAAIHAAAALLDEGDPAEELRTIAGRIEGPRPELAEVARIIADEIEKAASILVEANAIRREELREIRVKATVRFEETPPPSPTDPDDFEDAEP